MGVKLLHSADWHLDAPMTGFSDAQREFLRQELRRIPEKVVRLARREGCDAMLLAGDIFDGVPSRDTLELVKKALAESDMPVLIAPGNHDFCTSDSPWCSEPWPENVFIFTGGMESVPIPDLDLRIYGAGYRSMDCPPLLEGFQAQGQETYQIALLHGDPTQKNSPYCPITATQVRESGLDYLALGHIHKAGTFRAGKTLSAWPGCPMGRGWDETGDKGVCIVTLGDPVQVQAVALDTPRFFDLTVEVDGDARAALDGVLPAVQSRDFYRVTLKGYGSVDLAVVKDSFPQVPNLTLRDETQAPRDLWENAGSDTLEGVFFRILDDLRRENPQQADTVCLAAELSRKILDGREVTLP